MSAANVAISGGPGSEINSRPPGEAQNVFDNVDHEKLTIRQGEDFAALCHWPQGVRDVAGGVSTELAFSAAGLVDCRDGGEA